MAETDPAASLDRLHDIVSPDPVPWLPPAPGWYVLAGVLLIAAIVFAIVARRRWKAGAYRREALRELESADSSAAIAALLRRVALTESPRREIAPLEGEAWMDWLAERYPAQPPSAPIREQLTAGIYGAATSPDTTTVRTWAANWIRHHRLPENHLA